MKKTITFFLKAWKKHWKKQLPPGVMLLLSTLLIKDKIDVTEFCALLASFATTYKVWMDVSKEEKKT